MGGSDVIMAPQRGNTHGTLSIEILTPNNVDGEEFFDFMQVVTDKWLDMKDLKGNFLRSRPHWAKQWEKLKVHGEDIVDYMRNVYADDIPEFAKLLHCVAEQGGFSLEDSMDMFSNENLDYFFKDAVMNPK